MRETVYTAESGAEKSEKGRDQMTPMEAWRIVSDNLTELYNLRRTEQDNGFCDADIDAQVICFQALKEKQERTSSGK